MARRSNFKGEVVAEGEECQKFALWIKHCNITALNYFQAQRLN